MAGENIPEFAFFLFIPNVVRWLVGFFIKKKIKLVPYMHTRTHWHHIRLANILLKGILGPSEYSVWPGLVYWLVWMFCLAGFTLLVAPCQFSNWLVLLAGFRSFVRSFIIVFFSLVGINLTNNGSQMWIFIDITRPCQTILNASISSNQNWHINSVQFIS